jgi:membrane fusion protein, multidrug efflux system
MTATATDLPAQAAATPRSKRRLLMIAGPLVLILAAGGYWLMGGRYEETENAYLHQARISMASSVSGRIEKVMVSDNQVVKAGDVLFQVDQTPFLLTQAQAEAAVAAARIGVEQLKLSYTTAQNNLKLAEDEAAYQTRTREREERLGKKGISSDSSLDDAVHEERIALDKRDLAKQNVAMALAALGGSLDIATDQHPSVQAALNARDQASYNLANSVLRAPADGVVYQASSFKPGQMVASGQSLFTLVQTGDVWVEANFKETQLAHVVAGQHAEISVDLQAGKKIEGVVEAVGAGTGSEFSLLPAQNATGNWVKVTQRVPVRIRLIHPEEAAGLATGLSASVSVDTEQTRSLSDLLPSFLK